MIDDCDFWDKITDQEMLFCDHRLLYGDGIQRKEQIGQQKVLKSYDFRTFYIRSNLYVMRPLCYYIFKSVGKRGENYEGYC